MAFRNKFTFDEKYSEAIIFLKSTLIPILFLLSTTHPLIAQAQEFQRLEGTENIYQGKGGTKKIVDGVDFWTNGNPPRKYQLLGYITDSRHKTGIFGMIRMLGFESSIASAAKENGGDAVIILSSQAETLGTSGDVSSSSYGTANTIGNTTTYNGNTQGSTFERPIQRQNSTFALVKYVSEESNTPRSTGSMPLAKSSVTSNQNLIPGSAGHKLNVGSDWADKPISTADTNRIFIYKINSTIDAGIQVSVFDRATISNSQKFALNRMNMMKSRLTDITVSTFGESKINDRIAYFFELTGKIQSGSLFTYRGTIIEDTSKMFLILTFAAPANFEFNREEMLSIPAAFEPNLSP